MVKLLAIYPGMGPRAEMLYPLHVLSQSGIEIIVITPRTRVYGGGYGPLQERYGSVRVFRPYRDMNEMFMCPRIHYDEVLGVAHDFDPDVILSSQERTMCLSVSLAKKLKVPIVLWVETSLHDLSMGKFDIEHLVPNGLRLALARIPPSLRAWWNWISERSDAIVTCNPLDKPFLNSLSSSSGKIIEYIPWPIGLDMKYAVQIRTLYKKKYGIFAGSLLRAKNIREFSKTIPQILNNTPTEKFLFMGQGSGEKAIARLYRQFGKRILYTPDLPKEQVAKLIASAWYAYTPVRKYGSWQFIGDCWALGTPVVTTHDSGYIDHQHNGLVVPPEKIILAINDLFYQKELYLKLMKGGFSTADERHPEKIAKKLLSVLEKCLSTHTRQES